jgi:hypothetical protein
VLAGAAAAGALAAVAGAAAVCAHPVKTSEAATSRAKNLVNQLDCTIILLLENLSDLFLSGVRFPPG